jgi:hypothetical protein
VYKVALNKQMVMVVEDMLQVCMYTNTYHLGKIARYLVHGKFDMSISIVVHSVGRLPL